MNIRYVASICLIIVLQILCLEALGNNTTESIIFEHINNKEWAEAEKLARECENHVLLKIILSQKFLDDRVANKSFTEIIEFIQTNAKWPQIEELKEKAERYIKYNTNSVTIYEWFSKNKPKTGVGYKFYALASAKLVQDQSKLATIIREGWIYGKFTRAEEKLYLKQFNHYLREIDHVYKIDELLWSKNVGEAKRLWNKVQPAYQQSFAAQIAILNMDKNAKALFKKIPEKYYTSGLLFRYLELSKKEAHIDNLMLWEKVKTRSLLGHNTQWCSLQLYYVREFIEQKKFTHGYRLINLKFANTYDDIRETEWLAGWLALRFLNKPELALKHFKNFIKIVKTPISLARGAYWLARTYSTQKDHETAKKFYIQATRYPYTFYGQLASIELGENRIILSSTSSQVQKHNAKKNDIITAIKLLIKYGTPNLVSINLVSAYVETAISQTKDSNEIVVLADIMKKYGIQYMVKTAKLASQHHIFIKDYAFPTPFKIKESVIEDALSYAVIRQESVFDQHAISSAKAMGLMQLIKDRACQVAASIKVKCSVSRLTRDPDYNIQLGTNHLRALLDDYQGSYLLAIAAYNAGSSSVNKWLNIFGDPRKKQNIYQVIDWIELIPYRETRNYVQRVLESMQVYRFIIQRQHRLALKRDLMLGT